MGRTILALAGLIAVLPLSGCKSPYVNATVRNDTGGAVSLVEVDYPSASFGRDAIPAGANYPYRFKIIGSGATKVSWTDAQNKQHTSSGPELHEGQHGFLTITLTPRSAQWAAQLTPRD